MLPKLSIIIPCYNSESTLEETLISVRDQVFENWEAIIVNDGSLDNLEAIALHWMARDTRFKYFKKENGGLGNARNFGIEKAKGAYILPLDSDNKVKPQFTKKAIAILDTDPNVGVVHGNALYFGEKQGIWEVDSFDFERMLLQNYIDACAVYRKSLWKEIGGYDTQMPYQGNEDWELWLAMGAKNIGFKHLDELTFDYRFSKDSMIRSFSSEMFTANKDYIRKKYSEHYFLFFKKNYKTLARYHENPRKTTFFFLKKWVKTFIK